MTAPIGRRWSLRHAASRLPLSRTCVRFPDGPLRAAALAAGLPIRAATTVTGTRGRRRVSAVRAVATQVRTVFGASETIACDLVLMSAGMTPSVQLFSQSRGKLRWDDTLQSLCSGHIGRTGAIGRRVPRNFRSARRTVRRLRAGRGCRRCGGMPQGRAARIRRVGDRAGAGRHAWRGAGRSPRKAAGLRRFPERRHDQGSGARGARRLPLGRARQALHHDRHGDRSGQDLEHERARCPLAGHPRARSRRSGSRRYATLYAGHVRYARGVGAAAICSIRCGARRCTAGPRSMARSSRMSGHGSARIISRAPARPCMMP